MPSSRKFGFTSYLKYSSGYARFYGSLALLPLSLAAPGESALVVRSSALLDALQRMFWLLWEQAVPVVPYLPEDEQITLSITGRVLPVLTLITARSVRRSNAMSCAM